MATPEAQMRVKSQSGHQGKARSHCASSADVGGGAISGAERMKTYKKLHDKAIGIVRSHRKALGIM